MVQEDSKLVEAPRWRSSQAARWWLKRLVAARTAVFLYFLALGSTLLLAPVDVWAQVAPPNRKAQ